MDQVNFVDTAFKEFEVSNVVCYKRPHYFKFFKGCIQQMLLGPLFIISMFSYIFQKNLQNNWKQILLRGIIWNI